MISTQKIRRKLQQQNFHVRRLNFVLYGNKN